MGKAIIPTGDLFTLVRRCRNHHYLAFRVPIVNSNILEIGTDFQTLISSAEGAKDSVTKFASLWRARD